MTKKQAVEILNTLRPELVLPGNSSALTGAVMLLEALDRAKAFQSEVVADKIDAAARRILAAAATGQAAPWVLAEEMAFNLAVACDRAGLVKP